MQWVAHQRKSWETFSNEVNCTHSVYYKFLGRMQFSERLNSVMTLHVHKDLWIVSMTLQWLRNLLHVTKFERTFLERGQICRLRWTSNDQNAFSFRGAKPPWSPDQGLCPWTPLGDLTPDSHYRLVLYTRHGPPQPLTPSAAYDWGLLNIGFVVIQTPTVSTSDLPLWEVRESDSFGHWNRSLFREFWWRHSCIRSPAGAEWEAILRW